MEDKMKENRETKGKGEGEDNSEAKDAVGLKATSSVPCSA
jgi:hypothetical protein